MITVTGERTASFALLMLLSVAAPAAPWTVRESAGPADPIRAVQVNPSGDEISVYRDGSDRVSLEFRTSPGFSGLTRSSCPTFQVDDRLPLHYFDIGDTCRVDQGRVVYDIGQIQGRVLKSMVTHRLMNGGAVAFRYLTQDGSYHESMFELTNSKRALQRALGQNTRVDAE